MRIPFRLLLPLCVAVALCGCRERRAPESAPEGAVGTPQPAPTSPPTAAPPPSRAAAAADAGSAAAGAGAAPAAVLGGVDAGAAGAQRARIDVPLEKFRGFSGDESEFAFAVYSEGAGFYLLNVVSGPEGKVKQRFQLSDEQNMAKARAYLEEQGYSSTLAPAPGAEASVKGGKVVVTSGGAELYRGDPFGAQDGMGAPQSAEVVGASRSGSKLAVKVEQVPVTEFGGITTYLVIPSGGAR